jgi:hypothetical protein
LIVTRPIGPRRTGVLVGVLAAALCVLATLAGGGLVSVAAADRDPVQEYRSRFAPDLLARKEAIDEIAREIDADPSVGRRAGRYGTEVVPAIGALVTEAAAYRAPTSSIAAAHDHAVVALRLAQQAHAETARSYRTGGDTALLARAHHHTDAEAIHWRQWIDAVLAL